MESKQAKAARERSQAWDAAALCKDRLTAMSDRLDAASVQGVGVVLDSHATMLVSACVALVVGDLNAREKAAKDIESPPLVRLGPGGEYVRDIGPNERSE